MRVNGSILLDSEDKIVGAVCTDGTPVMRFGNLSIHMTWDELKKLHAECIKLEVTGAREAA